MANPEEMLRPPTEEEGGKGCAAIIAVASLLLLIPSLMIAMFAGMAGDSGSFGGMVAPYALFLSPLFLIMAAIVGFSCYKRYRRSQLLLALLLFMPFAVLFASLSGR